MNPQVKTDWVAALRSTRYTQGEGILKSYDGDFCALGVLCDLHAHTSDEPWVHCGNAFTYLGEALICPENVQSWAQLDSAQCSQISTLNDKSPTAGFAHIADYIETYL
jgi:hypothetical protein